MHGHSGSWLYCLAYHLRLAGATISIEPRLHNCQGITSVRLIWQRVKDGVTDAIQDARQGLHQLLYVLGVESCPVLNFFFKCYAVRLSSMAIQGDSLHVSTTILHVCRFVFRSVMYRNSISSAQGP
jgi:hypothetical protein